VVTKTAGRGGRGTEAPGVLFARVDVLIVDEIMPHFDSGKRGVMKVK
jgi:hypothetical protein